MFRRLPAILRFSRSLLRGRGVHSLPRRTTLDVPDGCIPASFLRGGTSKGVFLHRHDLPADPAAWAPILLGLMGSPDPEHGRQLNGMGGGVSSLSKVCVVAPPDAGQRTRGIDVVYTFIQVGIRDAAIDLSGNCGNLSSMIGVFALDEGVCVPSKVDADRGVATVRSFNTNTDKVIDTTFPVAAVDGTYRPLLDLPQATVAGVPGEASQILLQFVDPAGARTGALLPTGSPLDVLDVPAPSGGTAALRASLVDATNPTVFVSDSDVCAALSVRAVDYDSPGARALMEAARTAGAARMGLDPAAQAQPKVAALARADGADLGVRAFSMGVPHKAVPMTVGLCAGVAARVRGTLAWELVCAARGASEVGPGLVRLRHPGGTVDVGADVEPDGRVASAQVVRTGRRLMKGVVWWR